jgi:glycosyltransferase involved in cell wall biosynthesis
MIGRPKVVWLLDSREPTGASVMALRRMRVLRHRHAATALAMSGAPRAPRGSALAAVAPASGLGGEVRIARADIVVTTSDRTLASAAPRVSSGRLVHFLHTRADVALASDQFMKRLPAITRIVVPVSVDPVDFAQRSGLHPTQIVPADDFTLPRESLLGTARAKVILAAGRLSDESAILDLAEAFRLALPLLPGWQLRVAGAGPKAAELRDFVDRYGLGSRLLVLGGCHDLATQYLDAGLVVRVGPSEASGLSVLEALAAGVPVLGSGSVPAVTRHVRPGVNGWVLGRCDPQAIAASLVELSDPERRAAYAAAARAGTVGLLTESDRRALYDLFDAVLDATPATRPAVRRALTAGPGERSDH